MIVAKAVNMAKKMDIPILGLVENMSYLECPDCGKKISVFGESHIEETADEYEIPVLAKIPIDPSIASKVDEGLVEYVESPWLDAAADAVLIGHGIIMENGERLLNDDVLNGTVLNRVSNRVSSRAWKKG